MISKIEDLKLFFRNKKNIKIIIIAGHNHLKKFKVKQLLKKYSQITRTRYYFFLKKMFILN